MTRAGGRGRGDGGADRGGGAAAQADARSGADGGAGYASEEYRRLAGLSPAELEAVLLRGEAPAAEALAGWEFRGLNVAFWAPYSPIQKFVKGFYRSDGRGAGRAGQLYGYNVPVLQNGLAGPWRARPSDADPRRFGFFLVAPPQPEARDAAYLRALLLDYGRGGNAWFDPANRLRDYLVRVRAGSDDLLLGKAYLALGPLRVASNFFLLERHRATDFVRSGGP